MLSWPPSIRVFVAGERMDMRCGFDRLSASVREVLRQDPLSGHLFVFFGKAGDRVKILFWDRTGFVLYYKRLECGVFHVSKMENNSSIELSAAELLLILEGIDLASARHQKRYER
jgi:transposase